MPLATQQIASLLRRNLFLPASLKQRMLLLSEASAEQLLPYLQEFDTAQTGFLKKAVEHNPHFFADLKNEAIHRLIARMVAAEKSFRMDELKSAERSLHQALKML